MVADGGILVRLAPVIEEGRKVRLDVDVHQADEKFKTMQFSLNLVNDEWVLAGEPVEAPAG